MQIKSNHWYFRNESEWRNGKTISGSDRQPHITLHCRRIEYDGFLLASLETTNKLIKEPEVVGVNSKPTWSSPFDTYVIAINSENGCERLINKYPEIQGYFQN